MAGEMSISEARKRLPEIARRLVASPGAVEYIAHRDLDDLLAITTRSYVRYLETTVAELRKRVAEPFSLAGSIAAAGSDEALEEALADLRRDAAARAEEKGRDGSG